MPVQPRCGVDVAGVARNAGDLAELQLELGTSFTAGTADATDPVVAGSLTEHYRPTTPVLNAGAAPLSRPIHQHTWSSFSRNWEVDVQHAFNWIREALLLPLDPGSTVIAMSSGAAPERVAAQRRLRGSEGDDPIRHRVRCQPLCRADRAGGGREIFGRYVEAFEIDTMTRHSLNGHNAPVEILTIFEGHGERAHLHPS